MSTTIQTPVLFLIFNRPDTTMQVFERIRQIKPPRLYVAADGPRQHKREEVEKCNQTRAIINSIDWDCELKTLYRKENLGCKIAVSSAITWFFEQEESGIILEDDCLPDISFFFYCEELLFKYMDDERIGNISGNCFLPGYIKSSLSYDFSSISHTWGWATWRRVWKNFDLNFSYWEESEKDVAMRNSLFKSFPEKVYFSSYISDSLSDKYGKSVWDLQYLFTLRVQNQLSIYPSVNLVTNIGLNNPDATHTASKNDMKYYIRSKPISFPIKHPKYIIENKKLYKATLSSIFFSWIRLARYLLHNY